ncbi:glutathione peroxidase [Kocuria sp. JC486]|uniref:Glutathione peroxidase n=1 Tax=Kocuria soli TaxID=2485125 RepID=A0A3N3ZQW4_9MICC|nr:MULTISPECIES: glutathione peroxidase [Kocuria]NHU86183.1 glutathione peroxidase [Kocuria sp. JC486]ROZ61762.1 glutathione peroxidase [Kocuria soli]
MSNLHDFTADTISGSQDGFERLAGQVVLIVNTASECGFTPQYDGLEKLYEQYKDRGFTVLGFPCNQFGGQEPGAEQEIQEFCRTSFGVEFPLYKKVDVNGLHTHPLWEWLKTQKQGPNGADIEWNFTKFLVDQSGQVVARYEPATEPAEITADIEDLLEK